MKVIIICPKKFYYLCHLPLCDLQTNLGIFRLSSFAMASPPLKGRDLMAQRSDPRRPKNERGITLAPEEMKEREGGRQMVFSELREKLGQSNRKQKRATLEISASWREKALIDCETRTLLKSVSIKRTICTYFRTSSRFVFV